MLWLVNILAVKHMDTPAQTFPTQLITFIPKPRRPSAVPSRLHMCVHKGVQHRKMHAGGAWWAAGEVQDLARPHLQLKYRCLVLVALVLSPLH